MDAEGKFLSVGDCNRRDRWASGTAHSMRPQFEASITTVAHNMSFTHCYSITVALIGEVHRLLDPLAELKHGTDQWSRFTSVNCAVFVRTDQSILLHLSSLQQVTTYSHVMDNQPMTPNIPHDCLSCACQ